MAQNRETAHRYRWVILGVLWTTYLVVFLNRLSVGPLAPFFKEDLAISSAQVGMVMSAAAFGYMLTMFPAGLVVDKVGARWPLAIGELLAGTSMISLFFAPSYIWLLILMFGTGMSCGLLSPATAQGVIIWFPMRERATVMGFKQTAVNIGGIITAATLPAVALSLGWRYGFLFLGILAVAIAVVAIMLYKEPPSPSSSGSIDSVAPAKVVPLLEVLRNREIWLVSLGCLCLAWVEFAVIAHLVLYLTEILLLPVIAAGGLLAMAEAAGALAKPGSGFLSDRVFGGNRKPVFMMMGGIAAVMCLLLGFFGSSLSWVMYPVLFVLGLAAIGFGGVFITLLGEFGGRYGTGKAVGMGSSITMVGIMLGPVVFGHIVDTSGSYELAWLSLAFMAALCVALISLIKEERRKI